MNIDQTIDTLVVAIYAPSLFTLIQQSKVRGMSGTFGEGKPGCVTLRTYTIAGRTMLTISRREQNITLMVAEDDATGVTMGLHTVENVNRREARELIYDLCWYWEPDLFHADEHVTIA